jgi:hypothetical protein
MRSLARNILRLGFGHVRIRRLDAEDDCVHNSCCCCVDSTALLGHYTLASSIKDTSTWLDRGPFLGLLRRVGPDDERPANRDICCDFGVSHLS